MTPVERILKRIRKGGYYNVPSAEGKTVSKETRQALADALEKHRLGLDKEY